MKYINKNNSKWDGIVYYKKTSFIENARMFLNCLVRNKHDWVARQEWLAFRNKCKFCNKSR